MTKEEIEKLINSKKFSKTIRCYGDDKLENIIKEIYYDGMREGYELAKFRLNLLNGMPLEQRMNIGTIMRKISEVFWIYVNNMRLVENGRTCSKFCSFSNRESVKK